MRTTQSLYARYRLPLGALPSARSGSFTENDRAAVRQALAALEAITAHPAFARGAPSQDEILGYALALMQLRECASAAGCERLANACDALAVTVARALENRDPVRCAPGVALTHFIAHARAMIAMEVDGAAATCAVPARRESGGTRAHTH